MYLKFNKIKNNSKTYSVLTTLSQIKFKKCYNQNDVKNNNYKF